MGMPIVGLVFSLEAAGFCGDACLGEAVEVTYAILQVRGKLGEARGGAQVRLSAKELFWLLDANGGGQLSLEEVRLIGWRRCWVSVLSKDNLRMFRESNGISPRAHAPHARSELSLCLCIFC
jgi:hypothetical protein